MFDTIKRFAVRHRLALLVGALSLGAGVALAQILTVPLVSSVNSGDAFYDIPNGNQSTTSTYASGTQVRGYVFAQGGIRTAKPVLTTTGSTCGGSTATSVGTDVSGIVTEGSSASTSCVITFATAFVTAPECFVTINNVTDSSLKCATSTTALTVTQSSASSNVLNYLIVGAPGG